MLSDKGLRIRVPSFKIHRANHSLKCICQNLLASAQATVLLAAAHTEQWLIPQLVAGFPDALSTYQGRSPRSKRSFGIRKVAKEVVGHNQLKNSITEKF